MTRLPSTAMNAYGSNDLTSIFGRVSVVAISRPPFPPWRPLEDLRPSTPAIRLRAVGHETRPVGESERPYGQTRSRGRGSRPRLLCRGAVRAAVGGVQKGGSRLRPADDQPRTLPQVGHRRRRPLLPASTAGVTPRA